MAQGVKHPGAAFPAHFGAAGCCPVPHPGQGELKKRTRVENNICCPFTESGSEENQSEQAGGRGYLSARITWHLIDYYFWRHRRRARFVGGCDFDEQEIAKKSLPRARVPHHIKRPPPVCVFGGGVVSEAGLCGGGSTAARRPGRCGRQEHLGGAGRWMGGWVARCGGGGVGHFRDFPGRLPARKSAPRAARPPPPAARPGRAEGADGTGALSRRDANRRARAPGPQMIWVESGSSLAFHRLSRDSIYAILSVRLAKFRSQLENGTDLVTDSRGVPDDVRASLHPLATTRGAQAVPSRHRRRGPFEAGPAPAPAPIGRTRYRPPPAGLVPLLAAAGALRRDAADVRDGDGEEGGARRGRRGRRRSALSARAVLAEGQMVPQRRGAIWYGLPVFSGMRWLCCAGVAVII
eukprot:gene15200-biopygen11204